MLSLGYPSFHLTLSCIPMFHPLFLSYFTCTLWNNSACCCRMDTHLSSVSMEQMGHVYLQNVCNCAWLSSSVNDHCLTWELDSEVVKGMCTKRMTDATGKWLRSIDYVFNFTSLNKIQHTWFHSWPWFLHTVSERMHSEWTCPPTVS